MSECPRILALDLSLTATGYCKDDDMGVIKTPANKLRGWERIDDIVSRIGDLTLGVDVAVIEGYSYASKGRSIFQIAELGGIVRWELYSRRLPYVDVAPSCLKRYATGKGNANKDAMIAAAIHRFGFQGSDNNEADAFLLYCMARHAYGHPVARVTAVQAESVGKVEWPEIERTDHV